MPTQTTYRKMGWIAGTFHLCMMVFTAGLWTPVYLLARRGRKTVTQLPPAQPWGPYPPAQYPAQPGPWPPANGPRQ